MWSNKLCIPWWVWDYVTSVGADVHLSGDMQNIAASLAEAAKEALLNTGMLQAGLASPAFPAWQDWVRSWAWTQVPLPNSKGIQCIAKNYSLHSHRKSQGWKSMPWSDTLPPQDWLLSLDNVPNFLSSSEAFPVCWHLSWAKPIFPKLSALPSALKVTFISRSGQVNVCWQDRLLGLCCANAAFQMQLTRRGKCCVFAELFRKIYQLLLVTVVCGMASFILFGFRRLTKLHFYLTISPRNSWYTWFYPPTLF